MESEVETPSTMIPTALDEDAVSHDSELANQAVRDSPSFVAKRAVVPEFPFTRGMKKMRASHRGKRRPLPLTRSDKTRKLSEELCEKLGCNMLEAHFPSTPQHFECLKTLDAVHDVFQQVLDGLELAKHMIPYAAHDIFAMVDMLLTEVASFCCNQLLPKMFRFKDLFCSITEFLNSYMTEKWLPAIEHAYMDQTKAAHSMNVIMFWDRVVRVTAKEAGMERDVSSAFLRKALRDASVRTTGGGSKDGVAMRR